MREVVVVGVRVEKPHTSPVVLLREVDGNRIVPIWMGATEATAIVAAMEDEVPPRPMTHDLFVDVLDTLDATVNEAHIVDVDDGVFFGVVIVDGQASSCRPSDGISLALRAGAPIMCAEDVLDAVGVVWDSPESEVEKFRAFLDDVSAEDFGNP